MAGRIVVLPTMNFKLFPVYAFWVLLSVTASDAAIKPTDSSAMGMQAEANLATLTFNDPKTGAILWIAHARSLDASTSGAASNVVGRMRSVSGTLYQKGTPANNLTADFVTANQQEKTVIATGNVTVHSLTDKTSVVHCDRLFWNANTNILTGTGHVVFQKANFTQTGPSFQADTKLRTLTMPAPDTSGGKIVAHLRGDK